MMVQYTVHCVVHCMIEPEQSCHGSVPRLQDDMDNAEEFVKFAVSQALEHCRADLEFFDQYYEKVK